MIPDEVRGIVLWPVRSLAPLACPCGFRSRYNCLYVQEFGLCKQACQHSAPLPPAESARRQQRLHQDLTRMTLRYAEPIGGGR